ncbi:MAG: diaminopimelate epimerase [Actinomycetota bacterium]|nr:diaminopimelate epimerase [Actinomycetota bacterium]
MTVQLPAVRFAKGHGTENDFVLVPDASGEFDPSPSQVSALCDRRAGIGGDGLIRAVPVAAVDEVAGSFGPDVVWFMDYRNADGSIAEMCGNGLRVFVAYLEHLGWIQLADGGTVTVGTRAGAKRVRRDGDLLAADLGPWRVVGGGPAATTGSDARVSIFGGPSVLPGLSIDVGNPHVVVALPDTDRLAAADLRTQPMVDPSPPDGTNVEIVVPLPHREVGHLAMRVFERGVGETRSCGTGAVAAVLAARVWGGSGAPDRWLVDVPGGRLRVVVPSDSRLAGEHVELAGPATIVAEGTIKVTEGSSR